MGSPEEAARKFTKFLRNGSGNEMVNRGSAYFVFGFSALVFAALCTGEEEHRKLWKMLLERNV